MDIIAFTTKIARMDDSDLVDQLAVTSAYHSCTKIGSSEWEDSRDALVAVKGELVQRLSA